MSAFSDYYENIILEHMISGSAFTPSGTVYAALFLGNTGFETNNPSQEISGNGYARQSILFNRPAGGTITSSGTVIFPTASADWGTASHWAVMDAVSSGNLLMGGALDAGKFVQSNDAFRFLPGSARLVVE